MLWLHDVDFLLISFYWLVNSNTVYECRAPTQC